MSCSFTLLRSEPDKLNLFKTLWNEKVQQHHLQQAEELLEEDMAWRIDDTDDEAGNPEIEQFGRTVRDIDDGRHATENTAEIMQERVVSVIMRRERHVYQSDDHQPYHYPLFPVTAFEQCRGDKDDDREHIDREVVIVRNEVRSAGHAVGQAVAIDGAQRDVKDGEG